MRIKLAKVKEVDGEYLCTGCLTRHTSHQSAISCIERHNTKSTNEVLNEANKFMKEIRNEMKKEITK